MIVGTFKYFGPIVFKSIAMSLATAGPPIPVAPTTRLPNPSENQLVRLPDVDADDEVERRFAKRRKVFAESFKRKANDADDEEHDPDL